MQQLKSIVKRTFFGSGCKPFLVHAGLLRGLTFETDVTVDTQQITGLYEREISSFVKQFAKRARTAIDIGAGDGYYTLYFASQPGIRKVIACEPDLKRVRMIKRNLSLNPSYELDRVSIRAACVGSARCAGFADLETLLVGSTGPVFLKIDVEGGELDVLESGAAALASLEFLLVIETHSAELERDCIAFLERLGYRCTIRKNGWYRKLFPELRHLTHNRWLIAENANRAVSHHAA